MIGTRIAVPVFPGTNSEAETVALLRACGGDAEPVHWSRGDTLRDYDAYVLPGGFAHEDRIRAGAIAAHDAMLDPIVEGARAGKLVMGICNGAQILLEAGLVPGNGTLRRPTAAFTDNAPAAHFVCRHTYVKLTIEPGRSSITAGLPAGALISAYAAHAEGRLAAGPRELEVIAERGLLAFAYARADGTPDPHAVPNGSALGCAGLINPAGNVLAIMPHPERDAWNYQHLDRATSRNPLELSGGSALFASFVAGVQAR